MEDLAPPLILIWDIKNALEGGRSVSFGIKTYLAREKNQEFQYQIETWWHFLQNKSGAFDFTILSPARRQLVELIEAGLDGESILTQIRALELEIIAGCESEIENHVSLLPIKLMLPLLAFIFPSMMLVLVSPLLKMLQF